MMGNRKRTERCSGQARDAWLESGQTHMRPPSHTLNKKVSVQQQRTLLQGGTTLYGAVKHHLKEQSNILLIYFCCLAQSQMRLD